MRLSCPLDAIKDVTSMLEDWTRGEANDGAANEALKFLVHFMKDLHMPLHLTGRDRGGNSDRVFWGGRQTSLSIPLFYFEQLRPPLPMGRPPRRQSHLHNPAELLQAPSLPGRGARTPRTIYDSYIRRIMWEGVFQIWSDQVPEWFSCPETTPAAAAAARVMGMCPRLLRQHSNSIFMELDTHNRANIPPLNRPINPMHHHRLFLHNLSPLGSTCCIALTDRYKPNMTWSTQLRYIGALDDNPPSSCAFPGMGWDKTRMGSRGDKRRRSERSTNFLIHIFGDAHQPMHMTGRERSGNQIQVAFGGKETNLHAVGDDSLITKATSAIPHNYTSPLPYSEIEQALRGSSSYDPYIRRIIWEGIFQKWAKEIPGWLSCPDAVKPTSVDAQVALGLGRTTGIEILPDNDVLCSYYWARPIHDLLCDGVWPKEVDPPYKRTDDITGTRHSSPFRHDWTTLARRETAHTNLLCPTLRSDRQKLDHRPPFLDAQTGSRCIYNVFQILIPSLSSPNLRLLGARFPDDTDNLNPQPSSPQPRKP
ncbi:hypothetical protein K443DRAFT_5767 [Laccaria amethystina LaAM-08-1]|uniref:Uncharacterized protein n=1 Tax=Laccaria amethystina LaAM-08-1 TaxID=1095629 RepID=A0A0C9XDB7_9AGAR|nr:hypothetical protein K443DRAFT_5767 [Laccaria amethystina LaAM-08-1]